MIFGEGLEKLRFTFCAQYDWENKSEKGNYLIKKSKTDDKLQEGGSITHKSQT